MNNVSIAILMATYNGEKYIEEQIKSILCQTYQNFVIYISDDGSTDNTIKIIKKFTKTYSDKVFYIKNNKKTKGSCSNFLYLLDYVRNLKKHEIFMFSDQDDFWLENKIETEINKYNEIINKSKPILIHTDLMVADENLKIINKSFTHYEGLNPKYNKFNNYLIQNNVTRMYSMF